MHGYLLFQVRAGMQARLETTFNYVTLKLSFCLQVSPLDKGCGWGYNGTASAELTGFHGYSYHCLSGLPRSYE